MSNCILRSSFSFHPSSLVVLFKGVCTSSSSLLRLRFVLVELTSVGAASLFARLLLRLLNHPLLFFVLAASVSDITDCVSSGSVREVASVPVAVLALVDILVRVGEPEDKERE
jgi:hypothetical protein